MPIYKTKKKKDGITQYRVIVNYTDTNGTYRTIERLVYGKEEAKAKERELEEEYCNKHICLTSKMTVAELCNEYEQYHAIETRKTSHAAVMKVLRLRVLPYLGDCRLDKLSQAELSKWKVAINKLDIAQRTKQNTYKTLTALLNYAVKLDYIPKNNLSVLGNFKDTTTFESPSEAMHYYTAEQFQLFIAAAKANCKTIIDWGYYVFFNIAFFTGARKGEINALKWSDVDGKILHIRRSISQKLNGGDVETSPKNKSSVRDLQLPEQLIAVLSEHRRRQMDAAPLQFNEDFRICGGEKPLRDTSIDKRNRKYAEEAGLPHIRVHDFRHSHVSLLANEGINIQEVARRLGHSNVQETWNTYCHLYPREEERAVQVLNKIKI